MSDDSSRNASSRKKIGFLGTGNVARALSTAWAGAGHEVVLGSRTPDGTTTVGLSEAAAHGEVIVNATPGTASLDVLAGIGAPALAGKVLIDIGVGFVGEDLSHQVVSLGEEIQAAYPRTRVVKTLATVDSAVMVGPGSLSGPSTVFLSGDDAEAKAVAADLLTDLGWSRDAQLDLGGIATARGQEHFALLFVGIMGALGSHRFGIRVVPSGAAG